MNVNPHRSVLTHEAIHNVMIKLTRHGI